MALSSIKDIFSCKTNQENKKKDLKTGLLVLFLYTAGIIIVSSFHELCFDETQAWLIAKCASYKELFTYIPHYEGHPPLWHLLLSVFAKNGAPVAFTLKAINTVFSVTAMALLIFRSPFPKIVRYLLPFTFYFFYQYGVLSRPYSLAMVAFMLMAVTYKDRNAHPWRYILVLSLLCLVSAYGIMLAGGLCIVWTFEIISELIRNKKMKFFWKDMRFYSLCFILVLAVVLIITILPADDCYYIGVDSSISIKEYLKERWCYEYMAVIPFDAWSGLLIGGHGIENNPPLEIIEVFCGLIVWVIISAFSLKNRKFFTFFLPYLLMTGFMTVKYFALHHLGLIALFHVFVFWIMGEEEGGIVVPEFMKKLNSKVTSRFVRKISAAVIAFVCLAPVIYSVIASVYEVTWEVGLSCLAQTIKENHLEDTKIMVDWSFRNEEVEDSENENELNQYLFMTLEIPSEHPKFIDHRTYLIGAAVMIEPYFDKNIFMNYNVDRPDALYMQYKYKEDVEAVFAKWREKGLPDFIIGYCPIDEVYDEKTLEGVKYLPIEQVKYTTFIGKSGVSDKYVYLYMRDDLFDDYPQFKWVNDQTGNVYERKT